MNEQNSSWVNVEAGVPQGSILGKLPFLIYINDFPNNLSTNVKLFTDDTSLFSVGECAFQWKMSFNFEPLKQAQEVIFTRKFQKKYYPIIF